MSRPPHPHLADLPTTLNFYEFGQVQTEPLARSASLHHSANNRFFLVYELSGELRGAVIADFPVSLDFSLACELGNVIASRWATGNSAEAALHTMISPPRTPSPDLLERLRSHWPLMKVSAYTYREDASGISHPFRIEVRAARSEVGHA